MLGPDSARRLPVTTTSEEARQHFERGREAAFHYQSARARGHLDAAIACDPGFVLAYLHRGGMSLPNERRRFFDLARDNIGRVTEAEGRMVEAFTAFLWDGRIDDAMAIFSALADTYPDDPYLPTYLGLRYLHNLGRTQEAKQEFLRASQRDPTFAPAYLWLGRAALGEGDLQAAEGWFHQYLELAPEEPRPYDCLGVLYLRQGRLDEAERQFEAALGHDPEFTVSRENLARVAVERVRRRLIDAIEERDPQRTSALFRAGQSVLPPAVEFGESPSARANSTPNAYKLALDSSEFYLGLEGDVATDVGRYRIVALGPEEVDSGLFTIVWMMSVEGWKIHHAVWTPDSPHGT
jgi:tetratricopeptide (TPR) repeat protein